MTQSVTALETVRFGQGGAQIDTLAQAVVLANEIKGSPVLPPNIRNNVGGIVTVLMMGRELGLSPFVSLRSIVFFDDKPSLPGETYMALILAEPEIRHSSGFEGKEYEDSFRAWFRVQRRGDDPIVEHFSVADAKRAQLWDKRGPWQTYPKDMLLWKAVARMGRRHFADRLKGIGMHEDLAEIRLREARNVTPVKIVVDGPELPPSDPLLVDVPPFADYEEVPCARRTVDGLEYDARVADLKEAIDQRAQMLHDELGVDYDQARERVRASLMSAVGYAKGAQLDLDLVQRMIKLAPNATYA